MGQTNRVVALDATRGLAVLGMILVMSPGSWSHRLAFLEHAPWHGYTPADIVFPLFLFSIGAAMAFGGLKIEDKFHTTGRIIKRVAWLILLGLFLNLLPSFDFSNLRIPGILQRIALCYGFVALVLLFLSHYFEKNANQSISLVLLPAILLLVLWQLILSCTSAPGFSPGDLSQAGTLASWVDRTLFTSSHLWAYGTDSSGIVVYDPEGLLATFPASINIFLGILLVRWLGREPIYKKLVLGVAFGLGLVALGHLFGHFFVINKRIWTSSFALVSSGWSFVVYCLIVIVMRKQIIRALLHPLIVFGGNAILAFSILQILSAYAYINITGQPLQSFFFDFFLQLVRHPYIASLFCSLLVTCAILAILYPLDRKGLHLRI